MDWQISSNSEIISGSLFKQSSFKDNLIRVHNICIKGVWLKHWLPQYLSMLPRFELLIWFKCQSKPLTLDKMGRPIISVDFKHS